MESMEQEVQAAREGKDLQRVVLAGEPPEETLFPLGRICITRAAAGTLDRSDIATGLARHSQGDWGELRDLDWEENDLSLRQGYRLLSAYHDRHGMKFWIITEADRSVTTVLLPDDY